MSKRSERKRREEEERRQQEMMRRQMMMQQQRMMMQQQQRYNPNAMSYGPMNGGINPCAMPSRFIQLTPIVQPIAMVPYSTQNQPLYMYNNDPGGFGGGMPGGGYEAGFEAGLGTAYQHYGSSDDDFI